MYLLNNIKFDITAQHVIGHTQYPRGWFLDVAERAKLGITEAADIPRPDERFFFVTNNSDGTFSATPRDLDLKKAELIAQVKAAAGRLLAATDWMVIRASETSKAVDAKTLTYRAAIRSVSDLSESAINACQTVDQLAANVIEWPKGNL